jgi:hypothetical protein
MKKRLPASSNKYGATAIVTDVGRFDSKAEYSYFLLLQQDDNVIALQRQVRYPFIVNGIKIGSYIADFVVTLKDGSQEIHEVKNNYLLTKGKSTPAASLYKYKVKLMLALYNVHIKTITNGSTKTTKSKHQRNKIESRQSKGSQRR